MRIRTVIGITTATIAPLVGVAGFATSPAQAAAAQTMPASSLTAFLGQPVPVFASPFVPAGTFPNVKVTGNCPSWLFTDQLGLDFQSGNAVVYRVSDSVVAPLPGGLNAEGTAMLVDQTSGATGFVGPAHAWFGQGGNANGQVYAGETVTFSGTAPDGSTISFSTNPGFVGSASGHQSGWGQQNLACTIVSAG